jgi:hypothetical protein
MLKKSSGLLILLLVCKSDFIMAMDLRGRLPEKQEMRPEKSYDEIKEGVEKDLDANCNKCCETLVGGLVCCGAGLLAVDLLSNLFSSPWMGNPATKYD